MKIFAHKLNRIDRLGRTNAWLRKGNFFRVNAKNKRNVTDAYTRPESFAWERFTFPNTRAKRPWSWWAREPTPRVSPQPRTNLLNVLQLIILQWIKLGFFYSDLLRAIWLTRVATGTIRNEYFSFSLFENGKLPG